MCLGYDQQSWGHNHRQDLIHSRYILKHSGLDTALHSAKIIKPFQLVEKVGNKQTYSNWTL